MNVAQLLQKGGSTIFSFEILPPLKGTSIKQVEKTIETLLEFDPKYINITTHHSENVFKKGKDGQMHKVKLRKRPGSVAIAAAIQNRYNICAIPHMITSGFSKDETEYALIDLSYLGVTNLLILRGDCKRLDDEQRCLGSHKHATGLQEQVNNFNKGISIDDSELPIPRRPFTYGMACYPELHEESPNMDSEIFYTKMKADNGAGYLVTQMFYDNQKYFDFVDRCRAAGITIPIVPGVKPINLKNQVDVLPQIFKTELPPDLDQALRACKTDEEAVEVGIEWGIQQSKELKQRGVPGIHYYTLGATESVRRIAKEVY